MSEGIPKRKIDHLILNYFIEEGHHEAAVSFARETKFDLIHHGKQQSKHAPTTKYMLSLRNETTNSAKGFSDLVSGYLRESDDSNGILQTPNYHNSLGGENSCSNSIDRHSAGEVNSKLVTGFSTIGIRREIKFLILKGQITDAIRKISEHFPTILDSNNLLHFKLLRLNLIEMIRDHKIKHITDVDDEKKFLSDILMFVRENLVNKVTNSFKLLKELEISMSLLCFNFDPNVKNIEDQKDLPDDLRSLFDLSLRNQCYKVVNRAILNLDNPGSRGSKCDYGFDFTGNDSTEDKLEGQGYTGPKYLDFDLSQLNKKAIARQDPIDDSFEFESAHAFKPRSDAQGDVNMLNEEGGSESTEGQQLGHGRDHTYNYEWGYEANIRTITDKVQQQDNFFTDEEFEEEMNQLQNSSLESKLERIIKLWIITERRIVDTKMKEKE